MRSGRARVERRQESLLEDPIPTFGWTREVQFRGERERERATTGGKKRDSETEKNAKDNSYRIMHGKSRP